MLIRETDPGDPPLEGNTFDEIRHTAPEILQKQPYNLFNNLVQPLYSKRSSDLRVASLRTMGASQQQEGRRGSRMTGRTGVLAPEPSIILGGAGRRMSSFNVSTVVESMRNLRSRRFSMND